MPPPAAPSFVNAPQEASSAMSITTASFDAAFWPDEIVGTVALATITGAPFARNLTPLPVSKGTVAFPRANPSGFSWIGEGEALPTVSLNDDADVVAVAKLAGVFDLSNESLADPDYPVGDLLSAAVRDSMSHQLDVGLLFGAGAPEPEGVLDAAPEAVGGDDFRADIIGAWGELVDAGANPEAIVAFASASVVAWELARTTVDGVPIHADGAAAMVGPGIRLQPVPALSAGETLVCDTSRTFLVIRNEFEVAFSEHEKFRNDSTTCRIKARFAVACPNPGKALRKITAAS
ncbi:MAG: phage major capsid protein [Ilumatobacter sp.]|nr:phage major capsid protein [Ilumatobacter sp.]